MNDNCVSYGSRLWLRAAQMMDFVHLTVVIPLMITGNAWVPDQYRDLFWAFVGATLVAQVICLGCPMVYAAEWLKKKYNPQLVIDYSKSFTTRLYREKGRFLAFPIMCSVVMFFSVISTVIAP